MTEKTLCQGALECKRNFLNESVNRMTGRAEHGAYAQPTGKPQVVPAEYLGSLRGDSWDDNLVRASPDPHQLWRMA